MAIVKSFILIFGCLALATLFVEHAEARDFSLRLDQPLKSGIKVAETGVSNRKKGARLDTDEYRNKYWTSGDDASYKVVQNRTYSKAGKFELTGIFGVTHTDPFLVVRQFGGFLGYNIFEYLGVQLVYWKHSVKESQAKTKFRELTNDVISVPTNDPKSFIGGNLVYSPVYGKLSVMGSLIIYYDMHLIGGFGQISTKNGTYSTPYGGIGQSIYLSKYLAFVFDYRITLYSETLEEVNRNRSDPVVNFGLKFLY